MVPPITRVTTNHIHPFLIFRLTNTIFGHHCPSLGQQFDIHKKRRVDSLIFSKYFFKCRHRGLVGLGIHKLASPCCSASNLPLNSDRMTRECIEAICFPLCEQPLQSRQCKAFRNGVLLSQSPFPYTRDAFLNGSCETDCNGRKLILRLVFESLQVA